MYNFRPDVHRFLLEWYLEVNLTFSFRFRITVDEVVDPLAAAPLAVSVGGGEPGSLRGPETD